MEKDSRAQPIGIPPARKRAQTGGSPQARESAPPQRRSGPPPARREHNEPQERRAAGTASSRAANTHTPPARTTEPLITSRTPGPSRTAPRRSAPPARGTPRKADDYDFSYQRKDAERRARIRRNRIILLSGVLLLIAAVIGIRLLLTVGVGMNTFYEGVSVDGLNLHGYTMEEAAEKLFALNATRLERMTVTLKFGDREWTISPQQLGATLDIQEQLDAAWAQGRSGSIFTRQAQIGDLKRKPYSAATTMIYDREALVALLEQVKADIDLPAKNASMDFDTSREEMFRVIPEENGRSVVLEDLLAQTAAHLNEGLGGIIGIEPLPVKPTIFEADLRNATHRIKRATTPLGSSKAERIHNIKLALSKFDGMIVMPGEEVSFNATTGPRGLEEGYQNAGVILDDEIVDGPGGGVCQVSTTLYQALVHSGIEIVSRSKHSLPVSYVEKGTDAAVAYDYKDLVFRNNTDTPIYLECRVSSGSNVSVTVYGRPLEEGVKIELVSELLETIPAPEPEIIPDTTGQYIKFTDETYVRKISREGYKVKTYAVTMKDGVEISRKQLSNDHYRAVTGTTYVGVTPRPAQAATIPVIPNDGGAETY